MSKRRSTVQLTRDDWREDSPEREPEPGPGIGFAAASKETLEKRVIRRAKRAMGTPDGESKPSPFAGISLRTSTNPASPFAAFAFGAQSTAAVPVAGLNNLSSSTLDNKNAKATSTNSPDATIKANGNGKERADSTDSVSELQREKTYYQKLRNLNVTFKKNVIDYMNMERGEYFDFSPVCNDYIKFASHLEAQYPKLDEEEQIEVDAPTKLNSASSAVVQANLTSSNAQNNVPAPSKVSPESSEPLIINSALVFEKKPFPEKPQQKEECEANTFKPVFEKKSIGSDSTPPSSEPAKPMFSFTTSTPSAASVLSKVNFGSFGSTASAFAPADARTEVAPVNEEEDDNYEPPKAEAALEEKDAVYTKE